MSSHDTTLPFPDVPLPAVSVLAVDSDGPTYGYTKQQLLAYRDEVLKAVVQVCNTEYENHLPLSLKPAGIERERAFGSVGAAARLANVFSGQIR